MFVCFIDLISSVCYVGLLFCGDVVGFIAYDFYGVYGLVLMVGFTFTYECGMVTMVFVLMF